MQPGAMAEGIVLYAKPGCCLCDEAKLLVQRLAAAHGLSVRVVSILQDSTLFEQFRYRIPVVAYGGQILDEGQVREEQLRRAFRRARAGQA